MATLVSQLKDLAFLFLPGDPFAPKVWRLPAGWVIFAAGAAAGSLLG